MVKYGLIEMCTTWYTKVEIRLTHEKERVKTYWDIPTYHGSEHEDEN